MKFRAILIFLFLMVFGVSRATSSEVSAEAAKNAAQNFVMKRNAQTVHPAQKMELRIKYIQSLYDKTTVFAYIAHIDPEGFIVLPADTDIEPIIAYSFLHSWNADTSKNSIFYHFLKNDIALRKKTVLEMPEDTLTKIHQKWDEYHSANPVYADMNFQQWPEEGSTATGGWLQTVWHQESPYNQFCPYRDNWPNRSLVGCVAVVMAQIVNYHRPTLNAHLDFNDYYTAPTSGITFDADSLIFDFPSFDRLNGFLNRIGDKFQGDTPLDEEEIAALNFICAVKTRTDFTSDGSGANPMLMKKTLEDQFGFMTIDHIDQITMWEDYSKAFNPLRENMMNGLPAAMGIGVEGICDGGHLVIVDGYNTDNYFHLNFGWGQDLPDSITEAWYLMPYEIPANFQQIKEIFYNIRNEDSSQPALMITPEQDLYLYSRSNEYSAIKSFDISNNGAEPITIHSIQSSHSGIKIGIGASEFYDELSDIDIQPGQTIPFYVQLYSESSGIIEGDIIIQTINNQYQHVHCIGYTAPAAGTLITPENNLLTWSAGSSPYYVCGCVEIANSQTLVINPGTRIISFPNSSLVVTEGGALQAVGSENALIEFTAYDASLGWWGIDFMQTSGDNILAFCSISHGRADGLTTSNKSGGAVFCQNSRVTIHHCTIQNNWCFYEGGGIFASGGEMVIANNAISDNSSKLYTGGGMCIISGCNHEIHGNSLFNNSSDKGGGGISLFSGQKVEFNNNLIYNNTAAGSGGGVFLSGGYPFDINYLFCNNTIANNQATRGGGIYAELRTSMILKNSIIWGNQASSGYSLAISRNNNDLCSITLEYSNIDTVNSNWLSWPGNRDFSLWHEIRSIEPAFSDPVYHLSTGSPCIDMGNPNDDVDQEHFPHGYRINIGAYGGTAEAQVTTTPVLAAVPNPLQFGAVHYEENKQVEMFLKNGCFQALCIHDMVLEDTSVFSLYAVNHEPIQYPFTVSSGGIYACSIIFYPQGTVSKNYCSALYITYENDQMISIPITAEQVGGTIISTSTLSGHLNFKQSPYYIINDVRVNQDAELIIDPGVQLIFKNDSQMIVDYSAVISATGTEEDSIVFCAFDPSIGWRGIDMTNTGLPEDEKQPHQFHYCIFRDCNSTAIEAEVPVSIQDCLFEDNTVSIGPAALLLWNNDYFVKNNVFKNNRSPLAGGVFAFFGEIGKINVFEGNAFINNSGTEAGAVLINGSTETGSPLIMMDNLFSGNESEGGGAIVIDAKNSDLEVLLLENTISDNISPNGSGILLRGTNTAYHPSPLYVRCQGNLIVSNSPGSAILCRDRVTLELVNNTIADNYSNGANALAAVYNNVSNHPSIQIKNNIIWGNDDEYGRIFSFQNMSPDSITIAYTAIDTSSSDSWYGDVTWGYGNIFNNPIFLDTLNYMLDNDSPCIDAGSPDQVYNDIEDPENPGYAQWPALGTCRNDMGRYGGPGAAEYITDVVDRSLNFHGIPDGIALFQNYPNPFNPITTIHYQLPNDCHVVLKIFNMLGQEVTTLVDAKQRTGYYDIQWEADQNVSGLYFYYFRAASNNGQSVEIMKKMLLLK